MIVRSEVQTMMKMLMLIFWVVMLFGLIVDTNVSDNHTASSTPL
jgi:hypothetical protein